MNPLVQPVTLGLSYLTLLGGILIILWLIWLMGRRSFKSGKINRWLDVFSAQGIKFAFVIALVATLGSLFYSEIAGFEPCKLCWYQRILMYPQVLLWGMAWWKQDKHIADYAISLALVGAVIAAYHYLLALKPTVAVTCSAIGYSASCAQNFFLQLGYITIPMMALTAFILIIICGLAVKRRQ